MAEIVDIKMPAGQQEGTQSVISQWLIKLGGSVRENQPILEINTDKVTMELASPASGVLKKILKEVDAQVKPGDLLGQIEVVAVAESAGQQPPRAVKNERSTNPELSPAVRKLLREHNLDACAIKGSGKGGRITHEDVTRYVETEKGGGDASMARRKIPHTPMRRMVASHMVSSMLHTAPHVTTVFSADLSATLSDLESHKGEFEKRGVKLSLTSYFVLAAVKALQTVPQVNSRWHDDYVELFDDCNIGVAIALKEEGLIVPVLHAAQALDLFGIAQKLQDLIDRARNSSLTSFEVQGGTFTITNHGVSGSLIATPIINQPQSAILGIGKMEKRPVVVERSGKDEIEIRPSAYVTLTIDHRILDGFTANRFLTEFVNGL